MKFLRFSYLVDFVAMNSLKHIYNQSVEELKYFLKEKAEEPDVFFLKENIKEIRSTIEPLFNVALEFDFSEEVYLYKERVEPFLLPPSGTNTIADFKILAHVNLKTRRVSNSAKLIDDESDYEDSTVFELPIPPKLCQRWLQLVPSAELHFI